MPSDLTTYVFDGILTDNDTTMYVYNQIRINRTAYNVTPVAEACSLSMLIPAHIRAQHVTRKWSWCLITLSTGVLWRGLEL